MTYEAKREAAVAWMGARYVLHKSRRVKRLKQPLESQGSNTCKLFDRINPNWRVKND